MNIRYMILSKIYIFSNYYVNCRILLKEGIELQKIVGKILKANEEFNLIERGDRILLEFLVGRIV